MKNITFSADEELITRARHTAKRQDCTLNDAFREWLREYALQTPTEDSARAVEEFKALIHSLRADIRSDGPYTRDEMNER